MLNNFYPYSFFLDYLGDDLVGFVDEVVEKISCVPDGAPIILWMYEWIQPNRVLYTIDKIGNQRGQIYWLINDYYYPPETKKLFESTGINIHWLQFDLLMLDFELSIFKTSTLNSNWNPDADKFLFLTGKPDRINRIRLLHKFYQQGLLEKSTWSFFIDNNLINKCRSLLPELSDDEYQLFLSQVTRNPDEINILYNSAGSCHYDGYPFDSVMYSQSCFRVISETMMGGQPINTEKTWVTLANRTPFMIIGYRGILDKLKQQGYRTFEHYLPVQDYDWIEDDNARLDAVVENTRYWLKNIKSHQKEISQDVEYNYQLLMSKMSQTRQVFTEIYKKLGDTSFEIFRIISMPMQRSEWISFYYGVKDPSWPDCWSPNDVRRLPTHIIKELTEVYAYTL
jgi:hypothetical protein